MVRQFHERHADTLIQADLTHISALRIKDDGRALASEKRMEDRAVCHYQERWYKQNWKPRRKHFQVLQPEPHLKNILSIFRQRVIRRTCRTSYISRSGDWWNECQQANKRYASACLKQRFCERGNESWRGKAGPSARQHHTLSSAPGTATPDFYRHRKRHQGEKSLFVWQELACFTYNSLIFLRTDRKKNHWLQIKPTPREPGWEPGLAPQTSFNSPAPGSLQKRNTFQLQKSRKTVTTKKKSLPSNTLR